MNNTFNPPLNKGEVDVCFDDIDIYDTIGNGGQGTVFKGKANNKTFAVKIFYPSKLLQKRAKREVKQLKKIKSPYIVDLFDYGKVKLRDKDCFYHITNFIPGRIVRDLIKDKLTENETKKLIKNLSKAIDCLWSYKIVHCDIKPENIIYNQQKNTFILFDLGIAKHLNMGTITQYGMVLGTPGYMSPEQMKNRKNLTIRTDIFALGIVAFEALTGNHPFNRSQLMIGREKPPSISLFCDDIDVNLEKVINKMIEQKAINRPLSGQQIIKML